jgi:hypothetical protein
MMWPPGNTSVLEYEDELVLLAQVSAPDSNMPEATVWESDGREQ